MAKWHNWTSANIAVWNKSKFPKNSATKQRRKLAGEMQEFKEAITPAHRLEELADVYIASAALWTRYHDFNGRLMVEFIERSKKWNEIADAVDCKMDINATRKFIRKFGEWRHDEE